MSYQYTLLLPPLHTTADAAIHWFCKNLGLPTNAIMVEQSIHPDIGLRPTFSAQTRDYHTLCIEVSESLYPNTLDAFVLSCRDKGMPVRFFVAVPKGTLEKETAKRLNAAKNAGVGILEVDNSSGSMIQNALSLSLTGVRKIDVLSFPPKYRQNLTQAEQTFRDGNPIKACSMIYEELEGLLRKFAVKAAAKSWWPNKPGFKIEKDPWALIVRDLEVNLNLTSCPCPELKPAFMARIHGITPFRNDTSHKIVSAKALMKRDSELRTRFESAIDILRDFINATRKLKL